MPDSSHPVTMMAPHWLDPLFEAGAGDYSDSWNAIVMNPRFCAAMHQAAAGFQQALAFEDQNKAEGRIVRGGSPAQYARVAFLHEINQDDIDRTGYGTAPPAR